MKKYQYIVAAACLLVGTFGFAGIYATDQAEQKKQGQEQIVQEQQLEKNSQEENNSIVKEKQENNFDMDVEPQVEDQGTALKEDDEELQETGEQGENDVEAPVGNITQETLHFDSEHLMWPVEGSVLLDYSMDSTIFFPTLQQYQYHPAMVLSGNVNDKVYFVAKGKIVNVETNEVTGCTVTQDLGDGYTAVYGQLKELNFNVGDMVDSGQVVGYISEPTKYYAVEGSNVYFQLLKDGLPVDPEEVLP